MKEYQRSHEQLAKLQFIALIAGIMPQINWGM